MTDFFDVVPTQRACRDVRDDPVDDDALARVLDAATYAPSAENRQPWEFVVVRDADRPRARSATSPQRAWARRRPRVLRDAPRRPSCSPTSTTARRRRVSRRRRCSSSCAADTERGLEATVPSSIFPAVQNLLLAANALGLGSALTTITTALGAELARAARPPRRTSCRTPSSRSATRPGRSARPRREPFADHTHRDRYGTPW